MQAIIGALALLLLVGLVVVILGDSSMLYHIATK